MNESQHKHTFRHRGHWGSQKESDQRKADIGGIISTEKAKKERGGAHEGMYGERMVPGIYIML